MEISVQTIANNLTIRPIPASSWRFPSRIYLFVMAVEANILEVVLVETDLRVVAVDVVQPYLVVVDNVSRFIMAQLTDTTVDSYALIDVSLPGAEPWSAFIELLLVHRRTTSFRVIPPPTAPAYAIPAYNKETHSQDIVLCGLFILFRALTPSRQALCNAPLVLALFPSWRNRPDSNRQTR